MGARWISPGPWWRVLGNPDGVVAASYPGTAVVSIWDPAASGRIMVTLDATADLAVDRCTDALLGTAMWKRELRPAAHVLPVWTGADRKAGRVINVVVAVASASGGLELCRLSTGGVRRLLGKTIANVNSRGRCNERR